MKPPANRACSAAHGRVVESVPLSPLELSDAAGSWEVFCACSSLLGTVYMVPCLEVRPCGASSFCWLQLFAHGLNMFKPVFFWTDEPAGNSCDFLPPGWSQECALSK